MGATELCVFPKKEAKSLGIPEKLNCPCDRCTHTFLSPALIDFLVDLQEAAIPFDIVSGFSCQLNWLGRHGVTSGSKCLQGMSIRVRFAVGKEAELDVPSWLKITSLPSGETEISLA
jgi:hypothetical protein